MVKISVIVPIYNSEKYLRKCLDSLVNQTLKDIEIILINDGSKDESENIIKEYLEKYDNIKYIYQENAGQACARNNGIKVAKGEYLAFLDSDDYLREDAYEILWRQIEEKKCDILCFNYYTDREDIIEKNGEYAINPEDVVKKYIINEASPWSKVVKKDIFIKNNLGFLEDHIYEDLALIPTLSLYTKKIEYINECLYYYNIHDASTMRQKAFSKKMLDIYDVMEHLYKIFSETEYSEELEYLYIEHLLHGAGLNFLKYEEGRLELKKIGKIIKKKFPKWRNNIYYKKQSIKYKIVCNLLYYNKYDFIKKLLKIGR